MAAGAGATAVQIVLNIRDSQRQARGAAINNAANRRAVGFTKIGDGENGSEGIAAHNAQDYARAMLEHPGGLLTACYYLRKIFKKAA